MSAAPVLAPRKSYVPRAVDANDARPPATATTHHGDRRFRVRSIPDWRNWRDPLPSVVQARAFASFVLRSLRETGLVLPCSAEDALRLVHLAEACAPDLLAFFGGRIVIENGVAELEPENHFTPDPPQHPPWGENLAAVPGILARRAVARYRPGSPVGARPRTACGCFVHALTRPVGVVAGEPRARFDRVIVGGQATARPRPRLPVGPFGLRRREGWRVAELRALDWLRALGDVEELSPGHRRALGLEHTDPERPSRADFAEREDAPRVRRPLTPDEHREAVEHLKSREVRRTILDFAGGRADWFGEAWIELVNPPADIEQPTEMRVRLDRAVWRAEKRIAKRMGLILLPEAVLTSRRT